MLLYMTTHPKDNECYEDPLDRGWKHSEEGFRQCPDCGYQEGDEQIVQADREELIKLRRQNQELKSMVESAQGLLHEAYLLIGTKRSLFRRIFGF